MSIPMRNDDGSEVGGGHQNSQAQDFRHKPLPFSSDQPTIRLLELFPSTDAEAPLKFNLIHVPLFKYMEFDALSYCWGGQDPTVPVSCNGKRLLVTRNVSDALLVLRYQYVSRMLWVDAVCIDQSNANEKSYQVSFMHNIYKKAKNVRVWLGKSFEGSDNAMALIQEMQHPAILNMIIPNNAGLFNMSLPIQELFMAFFRLMNNPWFSRVWVVQEIAARSDSNVFLICGTRSVGWEEFVNAVNCINEDIGRFGMVSPRSIGRIGAFQIVRQSEVHENLRTLLSLLTRHRSFQATECRDKVFALMGLAGDVGPDKLNLRPDYETDVDEIYGNVATSILTLYGNLDILSVPRVSRDSAIPSLPTWVPDWTTWDEAEILVRYDMSDKLVYGFQATRGSKAVPRFSKDGMRLELSGFEVDVIEEVGHMLEIKYTQYYSVTSWMFSELFSPPREAYAMSSWQQVAGLSSGKKYIAGGDIIDAFCRTLCLDHYQHNDDHGRADFLDWFMPIRWFIPLHTLGIDRIWPLYLLIQFFIFYIQGLPIVGFPDSIRAKRFRARGATATCKRMFRTKLGYIGLAPSLAKAGDRIVLLKGGRVPLVIRPRGTCWERIGESYVHGIMQGELFDPKKCTPFIFV